MGQKEQKASLDLSPEATGKRLESWKEIAAYLSRTVRTVRRWEKEEGLPVHRHLHKKLGSVYTYQAEVDAWWEGRRARIEAETDESTAPPRDRRLVLAVAGIAVAFLLAAGYLGWRFFRGAPGQAGRVVLVVLPFANLSGDPDQEYFSDGMTEEMITHLAQLQPERLAVIARTSAMHYKRTEKRADEIARELGAQYLLEGSVRRQGERVRISAQLIRVSDQVHLWARSYDNKLGDMLSTQADVSRAVADQIQLTLTPAVRSQLAQARPLNPAAYEAYLRGRQQWYRNDIASLWSALDYFQQAIAADPNYALAHVGMADAYNFLGAYGALPVKEAFPKARAAAQQALQLDRTLAGAHTRLGEVSYAYDFDWPSAEDHFQRAIENNAGYAEAHRVYADFLLRQGRIAEGRREAQAALEIDPHSHTAAFAVGISHYFAREHSQAIERFEKLVQTYPSLSHGPLVLALVYLDAGQADRGVAVLERAVHEVATPERTGVLGYAYARAGRPLDARRLLTELHQTARKGEVPPVSFAIIHLGLGKKELALEWMEKAYQARDWHLTLVKVDPVFDPLRADPRFQDLLRRMNFSP